MGTQVLIVEDHPLFADVVHHVLIEAIPNLRVLRADQLCEAKSLIDREGRFDLVLLDLWLPDTHGFEGLIELKRCYPKLRIVILSAFADLNVVEKALVCGASGFISKATSHKQLVSAVASALDGDIVVPPEMVGIDASGDGVRALSKRLRSLTRQQLRVLEKLCQGLLNKQIAHELELGETTVKAHVSEILRKLSVTSRTQAVLEVSKLDFSAVLALYEADGGESAPARTNGVSSQV